MHPVDFPYIDDFCDDEVYVFSTMGQGPKGEQGEKGDASTDEQTYDAVRQFIENHPEYVTTIEDGAVTTSKLANLAVTTPKIADGAVTASKLSNNAIPTMSVSTKGIVKVGAGLVMNNGAVELDGGGDIATAVASWLDAHPEATTTVEDGSVTDAKLVQSGGVLERVALINDGYFALQLIPNKYILRDSGDESAYNGWSATDFIPVENKSLVVCNSPSLLVWGAIYDENKQYTRAFGWPEGRSEIYFNEGAKRYFRISGATADMENLRYRIFPVVDDSLAKTGYPADAYTVGRDLTAVRNRLTALEIDLPSVPSYYQSHLESKEAIIREHLDDCSNEGDGLIFITDTHFSADLFTSDSPTSYSNANNSFSLIESIMSKCGIGKVVFGGDLINSTTDIDTMLLCMSMFGDRLGIRQNRLRYCIGNHEYFTGADFGRTEKPTPEMLYGAAIKYNEDSVTAYGPMGTYYFDNIAQKIRYFVIPCGRDTETTVPQIEWILGQLKLVPSGYHIVCIGHGFMADNMVAFRGGYKPIADALDAVKAGTLYVYNSVPYDYSVLTDVTVVCMITGHTHIDGSITTDGGIPCICTTCDSYNQNYELVDGTPTNVPRTRGTVDEQVLDVIQFDFTGRKIYCTRIGYGSDRVFDY